MKRWWMLLLVLALALTPTASAAADGMQDGKVIFGGSYTLLSGETLNGDLVVFGGNVTVEETAVLNGSLVVMGGNVRSDGTINGDVVLIGGAMHLGAAALVAGDVALVGGLLEREEGARVLGQVAENVTAPINAPDVNVPQPWAPVRPWWADLGWMLVHAIALAGLAMLAVLFVEKPLTRVQKTAVSQPLTAGGTGLLSLVLLPGALLVLAITIILLPVALVLGLVFVAASLFGWLALGVETGRRLARAFAADWSPVVAAGLGVFILNLVTDLLGFIPCLGWLPSLLIFSIGLGAVLLTRFGTTDYPTPVSAAAAASPAGEQTAATDETASASLPAPSDEADDPPSA